MIRAHVGELAVEVHRQDRPRARADRGLDEGRIETVVRVGGVDRHGAEIRLRDRLERGDECRSPGRSPRRRARTPGSTRQSAARPGRSRRRRSAPTPQYAANAASNCRDRRAVDERVGVDHRPDVREDRVPQRRVRRARGRGTGPPPRRCMGWRHGLSLAERRSPQPAATHAPPDRASARGAALHSRDDAHPRRHRPVVPRPLRRRRPGGGRNARRASPAPGTRSSFSHPASPASDERLRDRGHAHGGRASCPARRSRPRSRTPSRPAAGRRSLPTGASTSSSPTAATPRTASSARTSEPTTRLRLPLRHRARAGVPRLSPPAGPAAD